MDKNQNKSLEHLKIKHIVLDNGFTVYLDEDRSEPNIYGCVAVKAGSKHDPKDATGLAHYLEHLLFKGTTLFGTIAYEKEKEYIKKIEEKYELLRNTNQKKEQEKIHSEINELSKKAAEFAIPNEIDRMLSEMGGNSVNAYTSKDNVVFYNYFPTNQIDKWLEIYSQRFINPVFRLFNTELDAIFEEKNMEIDSMGEKLYSLFMKNVYKKHPYGQQSILGDIEHLKKPSISKMREFYDTYFVANNMALILSGDFDSEKIIPIIKEKFGKLKSNEIPEFKFEQEDDFKGRERVSKRLLPIRLGMMAFRAVPEGHDDEAALIMMSNVFSNSANTGLLDKLTLDNKLVGATIELSLMKDAGTIVFNFLPKTFFQSLKNAERKILVEIEKVKKGEFSENILKGTKAEIKVEHELMLENNYSRADLFLSAFNEEKNWRDVFSFDNQLLNTTKEDIVRVANNFFGKNYLVFQNKIGFPFKKKFLKTSKSEIELHNKNKFSDFAENIQKQKTRNINSVFVNFAEATYNPEIDEKQDVLISDVFPLVHLFYTKNKVNQVFDLSFEYRVGWKELPVLGKATEYLSMLGAGEDDFDTFRTKLQQIGSSVDVSCSKNFLMINVSGLDEHLEETLKLAKEFITKPVNNPDKLKKIIQAERLMRKLEGKEGDSISSALIEYVLYGEKSKYLNRISFAKTKKIKADELLKEIPKSFDYELDVHYCGTHEIKNIEDFVKECLPKEPTISVAPKPSEKRKEYEKDTLYFVSDKKINQSQVSIFIEGKINDEKERIIASAFNLYFGDGLNSIVNQELREQKALAYSVHAKYYNPFFKTQNGHFEAFINTQGSKTIDAIKSFVELIDDMPKYPERIEGIRTKILNQIYADREWFRGVTSTVESWKLKGYKEDPKKHIEQVYSELTFEDIYNFYEKNIKNNSKLITIVGNRKHIDDWEELKEYGKFIELKKSKLFKK